MKKVIILLSSLLSGVAIFGQQMPISENYFLDKYSLAPSYAGNFNNKYLFMGYRSDWSGISGGPKTFRLSYSDNLMRNAGFGGKFIYDKAGIFKQIILLGTYSYRVKIQENHFILFGLSTGFYSSTLNLYDFYSDPKYSLDPSLISSDISSKIKFMSDVSVVYSFRGFESGFLFSNINFGDAKFSDVSTRYKPLANYQVHASYLHKLSENWDISPLILLRGGKYIQSQFEIAVQVEYLKKVRTSILFRQPGIVGFGIGADINKLLKIGYNFNIASNVVSRFYNNHEISIGFNIRELTKTRREFVPPKPEGFPDKNQ